jgi:hypothetical protein
MLTEDFVFAESKILHTHFVSTFTVYTYIKFRSLIQSTMNVVTARF